MVEPRVQRARQGQVAVLTLDGPPVNAFSLSMRRELHEALQWAREDEAVGVVVLAASGRGFSVGGDIREFGTAAAAAAAAPGLSSHLHVAIERMGKPVIAVVHGFALGGGLETVLACHYRIAEQDALLALPEVGLGTLPLSATQRLPRLLGVLAAYQFMFEEQRKPAPAFMHTALFDQVVEPGQGLAIACALAADLAAESLSPKDLDQRLVCHHPIPGVNPEQDLLDAGRLLPQSDGVPQVLLQALEAAVRSENFNAGMDCARRLFDQLMAGDDILRNRDRFLGAPPGRSPHVDPKDA
ncbi:enoyl-CoA hydratase/isomerase family protein [Pseudomonas citrulli]|jgi:enoyl-CoA hydratase|uniref:Enoyl-CoA hydratase/isomerase family protein n=1 Tax=Pseudomonas lurida TaxID=244566 RepID=A0ABY9FPA0_9PSED|nr:MULTISPECIES: enoyl-CoA hydratase/isomerase family protein [Pseudomonas]QDH66565.1 enoyl-CoA hydratase/isomerase family protein [Pseudomonas azotoformans]WLG54901.1 enoyl-CoA hydratase/isomerase family protein [Pseudomonas extremorientalis]WLH05137.1 enoyl-CoA hydratase/isomerase family protein [Pseudomonas lurida]